MSILLPNIFSYKIKRDSRIGSTFIFVNPKSKRFMEILLQSTRHGNFSHGLVNRWVIFKIVVLIF